MSAVTSKCLIFGYSYRWMGGTRDNMDLVWSIPSAELEALDPVRSQLLGGPSSAIVGIMSEAAPAPAGAAAQTESADFKWVVDVGATSKL